MRIAYASSAAVMTSGAACGMIDGGRFASDGYTGARGAAAAECSATGGIANGLGDRLRTLAS